MVDGLDELEALLARARVALQKALFPHTVYRQVFKGR
jgi:hypothetical protein